MAKERAAVQAAHPDDWPTLDPEALAVERATDPGHAARTAKETP
jgi:hypothetical protein